MTAVDAAHPLPRFAVRQVGAVLVVLAGTLTALSGRYGFHRDELYFVVAGDHPAWGYVDQPPLTPLLAHAATALFGTTPAGLRVVATLCGVAAAALAALLAREFGAGRGAQVLTACAVAGSAFVLVVAHMLSTTTVDLVAWLAVCLTVARMLRTGDPRWWPVVGAVVGVGLLDKDLVLLVVAGLGAGILVCGPRTVLRSAWLPVGAAVALLLVAPNLVWQARHGWPMLAVAGGIAADAHASRLLFVPEQLVYLSPVLVPVWVAGLLRLWRDPALRFARAFGLAYPVVAALALAFGGKPYYALPLLVPLLAAGAEPALGWMRCSRGRRVTAGVAAAAALAVSVVIALPVLPVAALAHGPVLAVNREQGEQVGWPEFAATVGAAFDQIPPGQRARAVIVTGNYGEAAALDRYGPALGLPGAWSGHMSFADWGPPPPGSAPVLLVHRRTDTALESSFADCRAVGAITTPGGVPNQEQGARLVLCDGVVGGWAAAWPRLRRFS